MTSPLCYIAQMMPQAEARLTAGDPVKNARALLRYALPIKNESARRIQARISTAPYVAAGCLIGSCWTRAGGWLLGGLVHAH